MKISAILFLLAVSVFCLQAQTNEFYNQGDLVLSEGPTLSIARGLNLSKDQVVGNSIESDYFQTARTATGLELGVRDLRQISTGSYIDHVTALEKIRLVPFAEHPLLGRLAIEGYTGAEEWFDDGSKGVIIGLGLDIAFTHNLRLAGDYGHQFETTVYKNGDRIRLCLQWRF